MGGLKQKRDKSEITISYLTRSSGFFIARHSAFKKMNSSFGFRESYFGECQ